MCFLEASANFHRLGGKKNTIGFTDVRLKHVAIENIFKQVSGYSVKMRIAMPLA